MLESTLLRATVPPLLEAESAIAVGVHFREEAV
jgi:hypothetical protein